MGAALSALSAGLGDALTPGQVLTTGASFMTWLAVQRIVTGPLLSLIFGHRRWSSRTDEQRHRCSISLTSCCFSICTMACGCIGLLFPSPGVVADPIYGHSGFVQFATANTVGFFLWNMLAENSNAWGGFANLIHHASCVLSFIMVQHPFSPRIACALMLFEASTPALCTFNTLRNLGLEDTAVYRISRVLFAVLFFVFRLALGIPLTLLWYMDMYALANDPQRQVHSTTIFNISLFLPIPFLGVQFYWFWLIARAACRKGPHAKAV